MGDGLKYSQRIARAQRAEMLLAQADELAGRDNDMAMLYRIAAREMAQCPDFADKAKRDAPYKKLAAAIAAKKKVAVAAAKTETFREKQARAAKSTNRERTKKWMRVADPILRKLHRDHPDWGARKLRGVESQWDPAVAKFLAANPKLTAKPPKLPLVRARDAHIQKLLNLGEACQSA